MERIIEIDRTLSRCNNRREVDLLVNELIQLILTPGEHILTTVYKYPEVISKSTIGLILNRIDTGNVRIQPNPVIP
jgi:hypothetical protein